MSTAIGYQHAITDGVSRKTLEWNWSVAIGYHVDRIRFVEDHTKVHTGETGHWDEVQLDHSYFGRIGIGYFTRLRPGDVHVRITDDWRLPWGDASDGERIFKHRGVALSVSFGCRW